MSVVVTGATGERVANHRRAIDAALAAGVSLVAYTMADAVADALR
jgi:NAD(P)H dehydrogenase (quinone)